MQRTRFKKRSRDDKIHLPIKLMEQFLRYPNGIYAMLLYMVYLRVRYYQGTEQVWATNTYCMNQLHIGVGKFYKAKQILIKLKLIKQLRADGTKTKFGKPYIRISYQPWFDKIDNTKVDKEQVKQQPVRKPKKPMVKKVKVKPICPHNHTFAVDCNEYDECVKCELWDECSEVQDM